MPSVANWTPFQAQTDTDVIEFMKDEDHKIYVIMFFNTGLDSQGKVDRMRNIIVEERNSIKKEYSRCV